jgi:hypothetical protein
MIMRKEIRLGAFAPKLKNQLGRTKNIDAYQKMADAITMLKLRGLLTDNQSKSAREKLVKLIVLQLAKGAHR